MKVKFTTTIEKEILKQLKIKAINENKSVSQLIEEMFLKELRG